MGVAARLRRTRRCVMFSQHPRGASDLLGGITRTRVDIMMTERRQRRTSPGEIVPRSQTMTAIQIAYKTSGRANPVRQGRMLLGEGMATLHQYWSKRECARIHRIPSKMPKGWRLLRPDCTTVNRTHEKYESIRN